MNCKSCNTPITYRFLTKCSQCGCEAAPGKSPDSDSFPNSPPEDLADTCNSTLKRRLANLAYVLVMSFTGMIGGGVLIYFAAGVIYLAVFGGEVRNGEDCARGMAVGLLSIVVGAYLGIVAGSVFAVQNPIYRANEK